MLSFVIAEEHLLIERSYPFNEVTAVFLLNVPRYQKSKYRVPICSATEFSFPFLLVSCRFALGLCFCAILTLILLLAIAGLLCGSGGIIRGGIYPPSRKRLADCGGRSLLA